MEYSPSGLSIIDLDFNLSSPKLVQQIATACEANGCFYIKNYDIDNLLINNTIDDFKLFFNQPLEKKLKYKLNFNTDRGYFPFETQNVNAFMGRKGLPNDPVEKFAFGPLRKGDPNLVDNIYPSNPSTLKSNVENYYLSFQKLATKLMRIFSLAAQAPHENYFYDHCYIGKHIMKANFYPGQSTKSKPAQTTRFAEHTDMTAFTILASDEFSKSLQVKKTNGLWVYADPIPNTLFVNLGDVMQRWTNDRWKATVHKVVWPEDKIIDRLSIVYFVAMNEEAVIECLPSCLLDSEKSKYEPITFKDYLKEAMSRLSSGY